MTGETAQRVAVGVLYSDDERILLAQRPPNKPYPGYWEFPGGKIEAGESAADALRRELHEELGIAVGVLYPWLRRTYAYPSRTVELNFFRIRDWHGELHAREQQQLAWQRPDQAEVAPMLPPNAPILHALSLPQLMAISAAGEDSDAFWPRYRAALERGVRLIQLREKALASDAWRRFVAAALEIAAPFKAIVILNGDVELAAELGAAGVQLTGAQLRNLDVRPDLAWVGASCHDAKELQRAISLGCDYALLSPVLPTQTHPDAPMLGWETFSDIAAGSAIPVFALGGMRFDLQETAWQHGAHGIAVLRAAWQ